MRRLAYKCRRHHKLIKTLGIIMGAIGCIIVLNLIPIKVWLFILGIVLMGLGWVFFKLY